LRKKLLNEKCGWSGKKFRFFNEIPTLLLVSIVFLVVFKEAFSWSVFLLILAGLILTIGLTVQLLAKKRQKEATVKNRS
jgi:putative membrane protein